MTFPYNETIIPPPFTPIGKLVEWYMPKDLINGFRLFYGTYKHIMPKEIINVIAQHICTVIKKPCQNPSKWDNNIFQWMYDEWYNNPAQREVNPFVCMMQLPRTEMPTPAIYMLLEFDAYPIKYGMPSEKNYSKQAIELVPISSGSKLPFIPKEIMDHYIPGYGDYMLGLSIEESELYKFKNIKISFPTDKFKVDLTKCILFNTYTFTYKANYDDKFDLNDPEQIIKTKRKLYYNDDLGPTPVGSTYASRCIFTIHPECINMVDWSKIYFVYVFADTLTRDLFNQKMCSGVEVAWANAKYSNYNITKK